MLEAPAATEIGDAVKEAMVGVPAHVGADDDALDEADDEEEEAELEGGGAPPTTLILMETA